MRVPPIAGFFKPVLYFYCDFDFAYGQPGRDGVVDRVRSGHIDKSKSWGTAYLAALPAAPTRFEQTNLKAALQ